MFGYQPQNLLNSSNQDLLDNGIQNSSSNLLDSQNQNGNSLPNDAMSPLQQVQQVMAMQHHYNPGSSFQNYHQLPQASVAGVAAAFGGQHNGPMNIMGQSSTFVGNPLNGVQHNLIPRYSLSHASKILLLYCYSCYSRVVLFMGAVIYRERVSILAIVYKRLLLQFSARD